MKVYFITILSIFLFFSNKLLALEPGKWIFVNESEYCYIGSLPIETDLPKEKKRGDTYILVYKMIGKKYFNKKAFPYGKKINFNSIRKGETVGEHEVKFSSGKEIITLNHEAFDRALYSEGALTAAKWLMSKKPGLYSMRNVLNFK